MPISPRQTHKGIPLHSEGRGGGLKETVGEIPPEWRCALDLAILEQPVPYDTEIPYLSDTILSSRVEQQFTSESTLRQVTKPAGIVTLEETYTDKYKQVGSRIKKFRPITDLPLIGLPSATRDVQTKNFGNYHFEETLEDSGTLFSAQEYIVERPDSAPEKFKELLPLTTESHIELGLAALPVLGDSEYIKSEGQQDVFSKKVSTKYRDPISFPAHLDTFRMTPEQQIATGLDTLDDNPLNISDTSSVTIEARAEDLGDGTWYKTKFNVPSIFHNEKFVAERDILGNLPAEFRSGIERTSTISTVDDDGPAVMPLLGPGIEYASEEQVTVFKKRVEERGLDFDSLGSLIDYKMTSEQQLETITKEVTSIAPTPSSFTALTVESEIRTLGGGLWLQVDGTVPEVFDKQSYSKQRDLLASLPAEFRSLVTESSQTFEIADTSADDIPLASGEISHSEQRVTEFKKKVESKFVDFSAGEIVLLGQELTEEYGGGILNTTFKLNNTPYTIDEGLLVVSSRTKDLGAGLFSKETKQLSDSEWPELVGTEVDPRTGIVVEVKRQVVAAGTLGGVDVDGYHDAKPIDKWRTLTISSKLQPDSLPATRTWETTMEHSFPNTLNGLTWLWASASGFLSYAFDSALVLDITQGYAGPCRALVTESFTEGPPPDAVAITQFFPQGHMVGYAWSLAVGTSDECDTCTDQTSAFAKTWPIPACLHDALTIGGGTTLTGGGITGTLPATVPIALPASGTLITKAVEVEPWRFDIFYRKMVQIYVP